MGATVAVVANEYVAKRHKEFYHRFVLVTSAALDSATSMTALAIYFLFGVLWKWNGPEWWGNSRLDSEHCKPGS